MGQNLMWLGYVVALLMVVTGLWLILRKPSQNQPTQTQDEVTIHPKSQLPITPRHLRSEQAVNENSTSFADEKTTTTPPPVAPDEVRPSTVAPPTEQALDEDALDEQAFFGQEELSDEPRTNPPTQLAHVERAPLDAVQSGSAPIDLNEADTLTTPDTLEDADLESALQNMVTMSELSEENWAEDSRLLDAHIDVQHQNDEASRLANAEEIVALYLYPDPNRVLSGERVHKILKKYGLRFGEMSCFHRYEDPETASPLMFSVLKLDADNSAMGFDLETLGVEEVKGLAFFLALPSPYALKGFDTMVSIAHLIARDIDGMLFDRQSLEFTPQLKEYWRHFVIEYPLDKGQ